MKKEEIKQLIVDSHTTESCIRLGKAYILEALRYRTKYELLECCERRGIKLK